jgi:hypothetical protein
MSSNREKALERSIPAEHEQEGKQQELLKTRAFFQELIMTGINEASNSTTYLAHPYYLVSVLGT